MKKKKSWLVGDDVPRPHSGKVTVTSRHVTSLHVPASFALLPFLPLFTCVCQPPLIRGASSRPHVFLFDLFFFKTFQMKKRRHAGKNTVNYLSSKMES